MIWVAIALASSPGSPACCSGWASGVNLLLLLAAVLLVVLVIEERRPRGE